MEFSTKLKNLLSLNPKMTDEQTKELFASFEKAIFDARNIKKDHAVFLLPKDLYYCSEEVLELLMTNLKKEGFMRASLQVENMPRTFSPVRYASFLYHGESINCEVNDDQVYGLRVYF